MNQDQAFEAMSAYHQVGLISAGILTGFFGLLIMGSSLYIRICSKRYDGVIKAIRVENISETPPYWRERMYYAVYEYQDENGEMHEADSTSGSNDLEDKRPGKKVSLLVMPSSPGSATQDIQIWILWSLFFMGCAAVFLTIAFGSFKTSVFTYLFSAGILLYFVGYAVTKAKPLQIFNLSKKEFPQKKRGKMLNRTKNLPFIYREGWLARMRERDQFNSKYMTYFFIISFVFLGVGSYLISDIYSAINSGVKTTGQVINFASSSTGSNVKYNAIVRFKDISGNEIEFRDRAGSSSPLDSVGDTVNVLYSPQNKFKPFIDRGFWNWLVPGIFLVSGVLISRLTILMCFGIHQRKSELK